MGGGGKPPPPYLLMRLQHGISSFPGRVGSCLFLCLAVVPDRGLGWEGTRMSENWFIQCGDTTRNLPPGQGFSYRWDDVWGTNQNITRSDLVRVDQSEYASSQARRGPVLVDGRIRSFTGLSNVNASFVIPTNLTYNPFAQNPNFGLFNQQGLGGSGVYDRWPSNASSSQFGYCVVSGIVPHWVTNWTGGATGEVWNIIKEYSVCVSSNRLFSVSPGNVFQRPIAFAFPSFPDLYLSDVRLYASVSWWVGINEYPWGFWSNAVAVWFARPEDLSVYHHHSIRMTNGAAFFSLVFPTTTTNAP